MKIPKIADRLAVPLLCAGVLLAAGAAALVVDAARARLLADDAERTAIGYARFVGDGVPGLATLLATGTVEAATLGELRRVRAPGDVFRFKLFDRAGHLLLVSDELDTLRAGTDLTPDAGASLDSHHGNAHVSTIVLGGANHVGLEDGRAKPDRPDLYSEAYVPLLQEGVLVGVTEVYVDQTALAARIDRAFLSVGGAVFLLVALAGSMIALQGWTRRRERARSEATIRRLSERDALSDALNRASFGRRLELAARRAAGGGASFSVLCIDLDRFKEVNDTLGHAAGDAVIREIARRLGDIVRPGDLVARLGGDEFALMLVGVTDAVELERFGARVLETLGRPVDADGQRVPCGASVGVARFGADAVSVEELLHRADLAMYRSKKDGRGRFSFYDPALDHALERRRRMTLELRSAIADGALAAHFQPLHESGEGGALVGYEALMRWTHPEHGMVPPIEFIALAEETGLIDDLGRWMLRAACTEAATWPERLHVAVNLSVAQFRDGEALVRQVADVLADTALAPGRLELEITESLLMSDTDQVLDTLLALSGMGVRIALDDFGTGYSSLSYLWRFPFDKLKIDRSFTQGLDTEHEKVGSIVRSIVMLAHSMGIRVNAEGVETEAQRARLSELGCDELQGYLLGRPAATVRPTPPAEDRAA